jgi:phage/plasmid-associated DNA primase
LSPFSNVHSVSFGMIPPNYKKIIYNKYKSWNNQNSEVIVELVRFEKKKNSIFIPTTKRKKCECLLPESGQKFNFLSLPIR